MGDTFGTDRLFLSDRSALNERSFYSRITTFLGVDAFPRNTTFVVRNAQHKATAASKNLRDKIIENPETSQLHLQALNGLQIYFSKERELLRNLFLQLPHGRPY